VRYPRVVAGLALLKVTSISLDGEVACVEEDHKADFNKLHSRLHDDHAVLCAFDLLELNGEDLRGLPLLERKKRLKKVWGKGKRGLQYVDHWKGDGQKLFEEWAILRFAAMRRSLAL
jgi:bifunctional non-homologous end joining protein LigD